MSLPLEGAGLPGASTGATVDAVREAVISIETAYRQAADETAAEVVAEQALLALFSASPCQLVGGDNELSLNCPFQLFGFCARPEAEFITSCAHSNCSAQFHYRCGLQSATPDQPTHLFCPSHLVSPRRSLCTHRSCNEPQPRC